VVEIGRIPLKRGQSPLACTPLIPLRRKSKKTLIEKPKIDNRKYNPNEVPTDYEVKTRKADREFSGAEYVRNGPPGPVLALLRSLPLTTGLVVGARGGLSRSAQ